MWQTAMEWADWAWATALQWLMSPAAWTQAALLIAAWALAVLVTRQVTPLVTRLLSPAEGADSVLARVRRFALLFLPLLLPLIAYGLTAVGEQVTRSLFGSGAVIAFGKRLFLFLAARILVRDVVTDGFLRFLGRFVLVPVAALHVVGLLAPISAFLSAFIIQMGNIQFSAMALVRGVIAGAILFWLGMWSNGQTAGFLGRQPMRPAIRQLAMKAAEIAIYGVAFLLLMNIMGISLSSLAILGGAIGVGLGFGLQKIASNFISGVILLVEGQATVGDYVEMDAGQAGRIVKMGARATILETFDGRWVVVPNEDFITTRVINYSDSGSANRLEAAFSVSYDTDINAVPGIIEAAVATHPGILQDPAPDCELRGFGDSAVNFAVEFWVSGMDDGPNKFTSDVLFLIWNACKAHGIDMPFPQRVVHLKGPVPA
jgi:small-conductance mechanosensitive channel